MTGNGQIQTFTMTIPILDVSGIEVFVTAVFAKSNPLVLEAYSEFDKDARQLRSAAELAGFIRTTFLGKNRSAHFFVVYPDMLGKPMRKTIHLEPAKMPEGLVRYTWNGWGLISVTLHAHAKALSKSAVTSNSEARARAWASSNLEWPSPDAWDWKAVEKHTRRLQRVLRKQLTVATTSDLPTSA